MHWYFTFVLFVSTAGLCLRNLILKSVLVDPSDCKRHFFEEAVFRITRESETNGVFFAPLKARKLFRFHKEIPTEVASIFLSHLKQLLL